MFETGKVLKTFTSKKGHDVILRYPKWEDLDEIVRYINKLSSEETFITFSGELITKEQEMDWLTKIFKEMEKKDSSYLFVFHDNKLIGTSHVARRGKRNEHVGRIGIAIDGEFREEGIGSALLEEILDEATRLNFTILDLIVFGNNERAQNMYKKYGFVEAGRVPGMIRFKDTFVDEVWMYKKI